jgi:hypothetical protein
LWIIKALVQEALEPSVAIATMRARAGSMAMKALDPSVQVGAVEYTTP